MSEIKHTSGPWQWDDEVWTEYDPAERAPWLIGADGRLILTGQIRCQTEADARLIAAAPELLDLVRTANQQSHTVMWQAKARDVIAKATGSQP
jgi:hypothetical protein